MKDNKVSEIFNSYLNIISPFIIQLETLDGEFPVEILNEIRSIFTHLARSNETKDTKIYDDNICKAERHIKRAVLDCFKYLCVAYDDKYKEFDKLYKNVDMSLIDNGDFLPNLCKKRIVAVEKIKNAKKNELISENVEDTFNDFENAYNAFSEVYELISKSYYKLEKLKRKATFKDRITIASFIVGLIGTVFGIIGVILAINSLN